MAAIGPGRAEEEKVKKYPRHDRPKRGSKGLGFRRHPLACCGAYCCCWVRAGHRSCASLATALLRCRHLTALDLSANPGMADQGISLFACAQCSPHSISSTSYYCSHPLFLAKSNPAPMVVGPTITHSNNGSQYLIPIDRCQYPLSLVQAW